MNLAYPCYRSKSRDWSLGKNISNTGSILRREVRGGSYSHRVHRFLQPLSEVLPHQEDRICVVILGFSVDGENIIGYRDEKLLFWRVDDPRNIRLTTYNISGPISRPWFEIPFAENFQYHEGEESQIELEVLQTPNASLVAIFCSSFNPSSDDDQSDRGIAVSLVPVPDPSLFNYQDHGVKHDIGFSCFSVFQGPAVGNRLLVEISSDRFLLVLNCGDILRIVHITNSTFVDSFPHHPSTMSTTAFNNVNKSDSVRDGGFASRIQIIQPSSDWWCSAPPLDIHTSTIGHTNLRCSQRAVVTGQGNFEVEIFLNQLLDSQLRKLDGHITDYHMTIIDPCYYSPHGKHHVLITVTAKIERRFTQETYERPKRHRDAKPACLIGVSLAIDSTTGHVAVLKSVHLKPPMRSCNTAVARAESSIFLERLAQSSGLSGTTRPPNMHRSRRLSNAAVLRALPVSKLLSPTMPIGICLD